MSGYLNTDASHTTVVLGPSVFNSGGHISGAPNIQGNGCVTFTGQGTAVTISCGHFYASGGTFTFRLYDLGPL